jgi:hypothetical protein
MENERTTNRQEDQTDAVYRGAIKDMLDKTTKGDKEAQAVLAEHFRRKWEALMRF